MSITEVMLARQLLEYLQKHSETFGDELFHRHELGDGAVSFIEDHANRILVRLTKESQDGSLLDERDFAIEITRCKPR